MAPFIKNAKILTVSGGKGGTGKSFASVNLAVEMATRLARKTGRANAASNNRVLIFDADFHLPNAHIFLGERLSPCLDRFLDDPTCLPEYICSTHYGVDLISFGGDDKNINQLTDALNSEILNELEKLEAHYDWIIVDTGAGLNSLIIKQILFADYTLIVTNPEATALIDCYKLLKFIAKDNPPQNIEICINKVASYEEGFLWFQKIQDTLVKFGVAIKIYYAGPLYHDNKAFQSCIQRGIPAAAFIGEHFQQSTSYLWDHILKHPGIKRMESFFDNIFIK